MTIKQVYQSELHEYTVCLCSMTVYPLSALLTILSAIFLKKIGSRTHSDPRFGQRGEGLSFSDARIKGSGMPFHLVSWERASGTAFWHVLSQKYTWLYFSISKWTNSIERICKQITKFLTLCNDRIRFNCLLCSSHTTRAPRIYHKELKEKKLPLLHSECEKYASQN
jgi:hypothetical protein